MYLQPYNNPRAGLYSLQKKLHTSTLNLANSSGLQVSHPPSIINENSPLQDSARLSRGEADVPGNLHKARSLDVLSESWSQTTVPTQSEQNTVTTDVRARSMSNTSTDSSFSSFSSGSESSSSLKNDALHQKRADKSEGSSADLSLSDRRGSNTSSESTGSASLAPRVPPRPKTEEILNRCTTMTRKAALATKTRLQIQPETIHSR